MLNIYALPNFLKTCLQPYLARSACSDTLEVDELVDIMANGRTTLTKPDITGCLQLFLEEVIDLVADGKYVKTPFGSFYLSARGRFERKNQPFTPGIGNLDHALAVHFRTNRNIEAKILSRARWERIETFDTTAAALDDVTVVGRAAGENARSGDTIKISGRRMKFDEAEPSCGVFLETDTTSYRASLYADIAPSRIITTIPMEVPAGTYNLVVVTMPNGKDLKNGYLAGPLIVA